MYFCLSKVPQNQSIVMYSSPAYLMILGIFPRLLHSRNLPCPPCGLFNSLLYIYKFPCDALFPCDARFGVLKEKKDARFARHKHCPCDTLFPAHICLAHTRIIPLTWLPVVNPVANIMIDGPCHVVWVTARTALLPCGTIQPHRQLLSTLALMYAAGAVDCRVQSVDAG